MLFMFLMLITVTLIINCSHPVAILGSILFQTFLICVLMWTSLKSTWFSFILFLIFLGGLMVLFVYVISLASNEKFSIEIGELPMMVAFIILTMILSFSQTFFDTTSSTNNTILPDKIQMIFSENIFSPSAAIMFYLFFTLLVAVKISSKFEGPLRNMT